MPSLTVGIDLAKNVFAVHGVNETGRAELLRPVVPRDSLHEQIAALAERRGYWKAVEGIASKNARMAWAWLRKGEAFALPA